MNKKAVWWVVGIVVLVIIVIVATNQKPTETGPIKIGFIGPLTGGAAVFGEPISNGVRLAEKQINDAGGINGRQVQVIYEDGKCSGSDAVTAAQKLINVDHVKFIIDGVCSSETIATAPIAEAAKVLAISPGATSPKVSSAGDYVFRNVLSGAIRGISIADYVAAHSFKKPAIISEKTDYADGMGQAFIDEIGIKGLTLVANESYTSDTTDFRSILAKVKQVQLDSIFLNADTPSKLVSLAKQARSLGITGQFFAAEYNDPTVVGAGSAVEGMIIDVAPGLAADGKSKELLDLYKATFGKDATMAYYVGAAYDDLNLLAGGIAKYGEDSTKVKDYFYGIKDYVGTIGTYSFDKNGDLVFAGKDSVLQKIVAGKLINL